MATPAGLHDRPVLVVDPGLHTAPLLRADADAAGRFAVTAAEDKTVRVWSLADGALLRAIRLPAGPGDVGKAFAVAIDPAGELVAAGGRTRPGEGQEQIYIFAREGGALVRRIEGLPGPVLHLAFAPDGKHLAAALKAGGLRVFGRDAGWEEVARDEDYGEPSHFAAFAPDGRLAATSLDGRVRLYDAAFFRTDVSEPSTKGLKLYGVAFDSDGGRVAVGHHGTTAVDVFAATDRLVPQPGPDLGAIGHWLVVVAWTRGGKLLAGGWHRENGANALVAWDEGGRGARRSFPTGRDTIVDLRPLPGGDLLVAAQDPWLGRLAPDGSPRWVREAPVVDLRHETRSLAVSGDGALVDFCHGEAGGAASRFDLARLTLGPRPDGDGRTAPPRQVGLAVAGWADGIDPPTLDGKRLPLEPHEESRSFAVHPDGRSFVLGAEYRLRRFDAQGTLLWQQPVPAAAWAVNLPAGGRVAVTAYQDGTIRWHRLDDGVELLALLPLADRANWVAWTPEGFYAASPGAHGDLRWRVNRGWEQAEDCSVADIPGFHRPAVLPLVLRELDAPRAVGLAVIEEQRRKVRLLTRSGVAPGAKLHVIAVGVSRYKARHAAHLRLAFAQQDAFDLVSRLSETQIGLYERVRPQYLADKDASRGGIGGAFDAAQSELGGGDDLVVVHFSGHGAVVEGEFYLLPHDVDPRSDRALRNTALPLGDLQRDVERLAARAWVLVLLDACYSGAASLDRETARSYAGAQSAALAPPSQKRVCVLASSSADEVSRERPEWRNGAFTEALLDGLRGEADLDQDGLIGANELANYVHRRVRNLTAGAQSPSMELRFDRALFAVGR